MADTTNVDLSFLARQMESIIAAQREQTRESGDIRRLLLSLVDQGQRIERRFAGIESRFGGIEQRLNDLTPELELILKSETMGRFAHLETQLDERLAKMRDEVVAMMENGGTVGR